MLDLCILRTVAHRTPTMPGLTARSKRSMRGPNRALHRFDVYDVAGSEEKMTTEQRKAIRNIASEIRALGATTVRVDRQRAGDREFLVQERKAMNELAIASIRERLDGDWFYLAEVLSGEEVRALLDAVEQRDARIAALEAAIEQVRTHHVHTTRRDLKTSQSVYPVTQKADFSTLADRLDRLVKYDRSDGSHTINKGTK
jgi:predicted  nucleic acid-binding Zn-ribbon protein